jgi:hypothetical protein
MIEYQWFIENDWLLAKPSVDQPLEPGLIVTAPVTPKLSL